MSGNWAFEGFETRREQSDQRSELERESAGDPLNAAREEALFELREKRKDRRRQRRASRKAEGRRWWGALREFLRGRPHRH